MFHVICRLAGTCGVVAGMFATGDAANVRSIDSVLSGMVNSVDSLHSAELHYSVEIFSPEATSDQIAKWLADMEPVLRLSAEADGTADVDGAVQAMQQQLAAKAPEHFRHRAHRIMEHYMAVEDIAIGGDVYVEFRLFDAARKPLTGTSTYLYRPGVPAASCIHLLTGEAAVGMPIYFGNPQPWRAGRLQGELLTILSGQRERVKGVQLTPRADGVVAISGVITGLAESMRPFEIVCDTKRDHVVLEQHQFDEDRQPLKSWTAAEFEELDGVWFPRVAESRNHRATVEGQDPSRVVYQFAMDATRFNRPFTPDRFTVALGPGDRISDRRENPAASFTVTSPVSLSLDRLHNLDGKPEIVATIVAAPGGFAADQSGESVSGVSAVFVGINIAGLGLVVLYFLIRRRSQRFLAVILLSTTTSGCGASRESALPVVEPVLVAEPACVDLGEVFDIGPTDFAVSLTTKRAHELAVNVLTPCGCTSTSDGTVVVASDRPATVTFSFDPRGKQNAFSTEIIFEYSDSEEPGATLSLPLTADIKTAWVAKPTRVYLSGSQETTNRQSERLTIRGPRSLWSSFELTSSAHLDVTEISVRFDGDDEIRTYSVTAGELTNGVISMAQVGGKFPSLLIPVLVPRARAPTSASAHQELQRISLTCGRGIRFSTANRLLPRARRVHMFR